MSTRAPTIKCLVWDLDNTLWNGTLLEHARVDVSETVRKIVQTIDERGILQSVASKNDYDLAWSKLDELELAEYFLLPQIGWHPKSESIRQIADNFQFAYKSIAFIDDQPAERAEVSFHLPEVQLYSHAELQGLLGRPEFSPPRVTTDSRRRRHMYHAALKRDSERDTFIGPDEEFLRTLNLELRISNAGAEDLHRVEELTLRTSQMNATGVHYGETELCELRTASDHDVLIATLSDRFGPYGAIGIVLLQKRETYWRVKLLATSCRVMSFGIGTVILNWLIDQAARAGVHLVADFRATERNRQMEIAYRFAGFTQTSCSCFTADLKDSGETLHLHIVPSERALPTTMSISAPQLTP